MSKTSTQSLKNKKTSRRRRGEKNVVKKEIHHEQYKEVLFERKQFCHGMKFLRSEGHEIYGMHAG